jgi:hypothetical protein
MTADPSNDINNSDKTSALSSKQNKTMDEKQSYVDAAQIC